MDCLSPEQMVSYVRGGGADPRGVEAHVRDCPACAMELLLTRETLADLRSKAARPATDRFRRAQEQNRPSILFPKRGWGPWVAAAALLVAAVLFAVLSQKPVTHPAPIVVRPEVQPKPAPQPTREVPGPEPEPEPRPEPKPEPPKPEQRPEPKPEPKPEPVRPPEPEKPPAPTPEPKPEPRKPAPPTLVEKAVVARVIRSVGGPPSNVGRTIRAGEALVTARAEFLDVSVEGVGRLYVRENTQAEIGAGGNVTIIDGEMLAKVDPGRKLGTLRTPLGPVEVHAPIVNVLAARASTEISIAAGRIIMATTTSTGPSTLLAKAGKAPEARPLEAGFASWLPDKLASRKLSGWFEAEEFPTLQGFKGMPNDGASGGRVATQVADAGALAVKTGLPFKGKHAVWIRARQYEAKSAVLGVHFGGQSAGEIKLEYDGKPWRWVGPFFVTADKLDLAVTALSRFPFREGAGERSFPVVVDVVHVTSDLKAVPPQEKFGEGIDFSLDEPGK